MASNNNFPGELDISAVKNVFPDVNADEIWHDLELSGSVETTINHILDGTFHSQMSTSHRTIPTDTQDSSDDDLPVPDFMPAYSSQKFHNQNPSKLTKPMTMNKCSDESDGEVHIMETASSSNQNTKCLLQVHDISDSDDNSDLPILPLSKRLAPSTAKLMKTHAISDSSDNESLSNTKCTAKGQHAKKYGFSSVESSSELKPTHYQGAATGIILGKKTSEINEVRLKDTGNCNAGLEDHSSPVNTKKQVKSRKHMQCPMEAAEKLRLQQEKAEEKRKKEEEKQRRKQEQEEKRQLKEYEKTKKKTLREVQKTAKPGEAKKMMTVMIDPSVVKSTAATVILDTLQKQDITYEIQAQVLPGIISFWREVTEVVERAPLKLETVKKEVVEDEILVVLSITDFVDLVHNFKQKQIGVFGNSDTVTLREQIMKVKKSLENRKITIVVQGIEKYFREQKTKGQRQYREKVMGEETAGKRGKKRKAAGEEDVTVSRLDIEEALIDAQLHTGCTVRFVNSDQEMAKTVLQYTKAVAEAPYKRDRLNTGLSLFVESSGSVKISKDGGGVQQAWRQQLQQFKNVKAEIANAIISEYRTPLDLWQAYQDCPSDKEAEILLQDIVVRRGVGVMATSRRVGKELSRRLYQLFTSDDPNLPLR